MSEDKLDPELEALLSAESAPAPAQNGKESGPVVRPKHRRRRGPAPMNGPPATAPAPTPVEVTPAAAFHPASPSTDTKNALVVWPRILQEQAALGITPDQIGINVKRYSVGPQKREAMNMAPIEGSLVAGTDDGQGPAEALYDWIVNYYHMTYTNPAMYQLTFFYRLGSKGAIPGSAELTLDSPEVIRRQLEATEAIKARRAPGGGYFPPQRTPYGHLAGAPTQAATSGPSQQDMARLQQLASESAYYRALLDQLQNAPPAAPAAPAPRDPRLPPPGISEEEWEDLQSRRQARSIGPAVVQAITAMGFTPDLLRSIATAAAQPPPQPVQVAAPDPLEALKGLITSIGAWKKAEAEMRGLFPTVAGAVGENGEPAAAAEEDPTMMKPVAGGLVKFPGTEVPMSYGPKLDDESWAEYAIRWGTHNPGAMAKVMEKVAGVVDPKAMGELMSAMAKKMSGQAPPAAKPPQAPPATPTPALGWAPRE